VLIGGIVWRDHNRDGRQNPGEQPMSGVAITLTAPGVVITMTTSVTGFYSFDGLTPGVPYVIEAGQPPGYTPTDRLGDPNDADNSDLDPVTLRSAPIVLRPGEIDREIDGGFFETPVLRFQKSLLTAGAVRPGQTITYQLIVRNTGPTLARNLVLTDPVPANTTYATGSASPDAAFDGALLVWHLPELSAGASFIAEFRVTVNDFVPATVITNVALLNTGNAVQRSNLVQSPLAPTAITLNEFGVLPAPEGMMLVWHTSDERETLGYNIWRSPTATRTLAQRANTNLLLTLGSLGGRYAFADPGGASGAYYWLEEVELNGRSNWHGPVLAMNTAVPVPPGGVPVRLVPVPLTAPDRVAVSAVSTVGAAPQQVVTGRAIAVLAPRSGSSEVIDGSKSRIASRNRVVHGFAGSVLQAARQARAVAQHPVIRPRPQRRGSPARVMLSVANALRLPNPAEREEIFGCATDHARCTRTQ
jgi:uncharacterized repeat protein (TIGR01451 family)